jgi:dipeptidyl aminopeptidase/acylaminoacyl peptidase
MPNLTIDDLEQLAFPGSCRISPDGAEVAFTVAPLCRTTDTFRSEIWIVPTDGSRPARRFTAGQANDLQPNWSPDGWTLYFLSDRAKVNKHEIYALPMDGGEAERLISADTGVNSFEPHPDGKRILFAAENMFDPPPSYPPPNVKRNDVLINNAIRKPSRLAIITIGEDAFHPLNSPADRHVASFSISPNGRYVAVVSWPDREINSSILDSKLHVIDIAKDEIIKEWQIPTDAGQPVWSKRSDRIWYIGHHDQPWRGGNTIFTVALRGKAPKKVAPELVACPFQIEPNPAEQPLVLIASGLDTDLCQIESGNEHLASIEEIKGSAYALSTSADSQSAALIISGPNEPPDVWFRTADGYLERLTDLNPELREMTWGRQERVFWPSHDGLRIDGLIVHPIGPDTSRPYPMITLAHGGPYGRWVDTLNVGWSLSAQWFAANGYAVFLPNPRGGMGHGNAFADAVSGSVGMDDWKDIETGIDALIRGGFADPDRLGIGGWSQGGFMAAWAVGQTERFRAGVVGAGVSDWGMMVAESDVHDFEADLGGSFGWEAEAPHRHHEVSPISFAHRMKTPLLILHGQNDSRVPATQAQYLYRALKHHDVPAELAIYPREGHRINEWIHVKDLLVRSRDWFDRYLLKAPDDNGGNEGDGGR